MTLTVEADIDRVKTDQHAMYLGQTTFRSMVGVVTHTDRDRHAL